MDLPSPVWMHDLEPVVDRRSRERRATERRGRPEGQPSVERRTQRDRRVRERRETVAEHLRNALQVLLHLSTGRSLDPAVNEEVAAAVRRVWLAIQEVERHQHP